MVHKILKVSSAVAIAVAGLSLMVLGLEQLGTAKKQIEEVIREK